MDDIQTEPELDRKSFLEGAKAAFHNFYRSSKLIEARAETLWFVHDCANRSIFSGETNKETP